MLKLFIFLVSAVAILGIISTIKLYKINKAFKRLRQSMATFKGIDALKSKTISSDEIAQIDLEFKNLTNKINELEQSSKGKLLEETQKSYAIIEGISDPIIVLDNNYKVMLINDAFEHFFNVKSSDIISKYFIDVMPDRDLFNHIKSIYNSNNNRHILKIISANMKNKTFYFDVTVAPINDSHSNIKGVVVVFQNVTQLKRLDKARSDFISAISNEFKIPLSSINMELKLLNDPSIGKLNEKQQEISYSLGNKVESLYVLVTNLIQLSKIESDSEIFDMHPCSIFGIAEKSIANFTEAAKQNDINLYHDIDENLPKVIADPEKIIWVLNNLISNSLKYTNAGDEISISAVPQNNMMCISVKDTGIGIPKEYLKSIFDKFIKASNINNNNGFGLGLTVAKKIIAAHKGKIWCESEIDMGSTFYFTIPISK